jgi:hypothetical protein
LEAPCGGSFWVDSADSSEKRISASGLTVPSVATHSAALVSPRRIASTPSWIAVAPEAQAVDSEIGEPLVPKVCAQRIGDRAEHEAMMQVRPITAAADAQNLENVEVWLGDCLADLEPLRPLGFDRRNRKEQRSGKIAPGPDLRLGERFFCREDGEALGQSCRGRGIDGDEVDRARHRGLQTIDREAGDRLDAGFTRGQFGPVVRLAGAKRGRNADAGDDNDRPAEFVASC